MKKIIFIFPIVFLLFVSLQAQIMTLHLSGGSIDTVSISKSSLIYFTDPNVEITRLETPINGATNVQMMPEFSWRHVPGKKFELLISKDLDFADTLYCITNIDTNVYFLRQALDMQSRFYWKVRIQGKELWTATWYFNTYMPAMPGKIKSFALLPSDTFGSVRLKTNYSSEVDSFLVIYGFNGVSFLDTIYCDTASMLLDDLNADSCYFMKIAGMNGAGIGPLSEVLAISVSTVEDPVLIINGFDRTTTGNSHNFIRQHASAILDLGYTLVSATNEAMTDSLLNFPFYSAMIYILGEESTADETFSHAEQDIMESYLKSGGKLFISGAEIAWDLDYKGGTSDKVFCHNYLHMAYVQDAPNGATGTYYNVYATGDTIFSDLSSFSFDNGTHGTYNVRYPDVLTPLNDAQAFLKYTGCNTGAAGVVYEGTFPGGSTPGKIMVLGFPFETIYPAEKRIAVMGEFFQFVEHGLAVDDKIAIPRENCLHQNYPNPFNPRTVISYQLSAFGKVELSIYDMRGSLIKQLINEHIEAGKYELTWDASNLPSGVYMSMLKVDGYIFDCRKMILIK
ncbi:MAG: T9SS type A sorting domain-containing protein [Candidatus Marinimicrobia bacterium]|nr:T9SS type A sorting domain-containing protein [Candidatus Neomarinimicrobiota bacterium]